MIIISCIFIGNIWRIIFNFYPPVKQELYYLSPTYIDSFVYGGIAAWLYHSKFKLPIATGYLTLFLSAVLILVFKFAGHPIWWGPYCYKTVLSYALIPIVISLVILYVASNPVLLFSSILKSNLMKSLGVLSFGIYLWHPLTTRLLKLQLSIINFDTTMSSTILYYLIFAEFCLLPIVAAQLSFKFLELPFLKIRSRMFDKENILSDRWRIPCQNLFWNCLALLIGIVSAILIINTNYS